MIGSLLGLAAIEALAWVIDHHTQFRLGVVRALETAKTSNQPVGERASLPWPDHALWVRSPQEPPPTGKPFVMGGREIPGAYPEAKQTLRFPSPAAGRRRVFIIGESAAFGFLCRYDDTFGALCERRGAPLGIEVVNAAQPSWTTGDLVPVVRRIVAEFEPSLIVIYAGNNEWIHWSVPGQPWMSQRSLAVLSALSESRAVAGLEWLFFRRLARTQANRPTAGTAFTIHAELFGIDYALKHSADAYPHFEPAQWLVDKEAFLANFEIQLTAMLHAARRHRVPTVLMTVPFQYKLSPAWKHPQPLAYDNRHLSAMKTAVAEAAARYREGAFDAALARLEPALTLEPLAPVPRYLQALCLEGLGRTALAEQAYALCREHMIGNLGSRLSINERLRRLAEREKAPLLDVQQAFEAATHQAGKTCHEGLLLDDCHPSPQGHRMIAELLGNHLERLWGASARERPKGQGGSSSAAPTGAATPP